MKRADVTSIMIKTQAEINNRLKKGMSFAEATKNISSILGLKATDTTTINGNTIVAYQVELEATFSTEEIKQQVDMQGNIRSIDTGDAYIKVIYSKDYLQIKLDVELLIDYGHDEYKPVTFNYRTYTINNPDKEVKRKAIVLENIEEEKETMNDGVENKINDIVTEEFKRVLYGSTPSVGILSMIHDRLTYMFTKQYLEELIAEGELNIYVNKELIKIIRAI